MKIQKIDCPSCGSSLSAEVGESRVICEFCGSTVMVEDTSQEGYNLEMGAIKARQSVSEKLANEIDEMTLPLCDYPRVVYETNALKKQLGNLEKQVKICVKGGKTITYGVSSVFSTVVCWISTLAKASVPVAIALGIVCSFMFIVFAGIVLQYWDNVVKGSEDTDAAIKAHENTLKNFDEIIKKNSHIVIPEQYRNQRAMKFVSDSIRSQQANSINHALALFDTVLREEKQIALQEEQIKLQKQQLEKQYENASSGGLFSSGRNKVVIKQRGHSILFHIFLLWVGIGFITIPYYTLSPRHYWHL